MCSVCTCTVLCVHHLHVLCVYSVYIYWLYTVHVLQVHVYMKYMYCIVYTVCTRTVCVHVLNCVYKCAYVLHVYVVLYTPYAHSVYITVCVYSNLCFTEVDTVLQVTLTCVGCHCTPTSTNAMLCQHY